MHVYDIKIGPHIYN